MTFLKFSEAKKLMRSVCKEKNIIDLDGWVKFTKSPDFKQYEKIIPRNPQVYYSKENVLKRLRKEVEN